MEKYKPKSIRGMGLKAWIDTGQTEGRWKWDYAKFREMRDELKMKRAAMARSFGFSTKAAMDKWWLIDDEERSGRDKRQTDK